MGLEFLGQDRIRINSREMELGVFDPSMKDGNAHLPGQIAGTRARRFRSRLSHPGRRDLQT